MIDATDLYYRLPKVYEYETEDKWMDAVASVLRGLGYEIDERVLWRMWADADNSLGLMGDVFYDVDDYEPCGFCHKQDENTKRCSDLSEPCDNIWYGDTASERMFRHAAVPIFTVMIVAYLRWYDKAEGDSPE